MRNAWLFVLMLFGASLCLGAEVYPNRSVRLVVSSSPGNTTDFAARLVAQHVSERLGHPVIVDNRGGAAGILGNDIVAKAAPDGYTLLQATPTFTVLPAVLKSMPYDTGKDFTAVTMMVRITNVLVVIPSLKVNTLKEFIALAQANPGKFNYGAQEAGNVTHVWAELFKKAAKVDIRHVPFKGGGDVATALLRGEVQMQFTTIPSFLAFVKSGQLRALAVATDGKRSPILPDVPSFPEAGISGMNTAYGWQGWVGPAGMPKAIANKLHQEVVRVLAVPSVKDAFTTQAAEVVGSGPEEFSKFIREDLQVWVDVVKAAGIPRQ